MLSLLFFWNCAWGRRTCLYLLLTSRSCRRSSNEKVKASKKEGNDGALADSEFMNNTQIAHNNGMTLNLLASLQSLSSAFNKLRSSRKRDSLAILDNPYSSTYAELRYHEHLMGGGKIVEAIKNVQRMGEGDLGLSVAEIEEMRRFEDESGYSFENGGVNIGSIGTDDLLGGGDGDGESGNSAGDGDESHIYNHVKALSSEKMGDTDRGKEAGEKILAVEEMER